MLTCVSVKRRCATRTRAPTREFSISQFSACAASSASPPGRSSTWENISSPKSWSNKQSVRNKCNTRQEKKSVYFLLLSIAVIHKFSTEIGFSFVFLFVMVFCLTGRYVDVSFVFSLLNFIEWRETEIKSSHPREAYFYSLTYRLFGLKYFLIKWKYSFQTFSFLSALYHISKVFKCT